MADTIYSDIKAAARQAIIDLALPLVGSRVYSQMFPDDVNIKYPCVLLTTEGEIEEKIGSQGGEAGYDEWKYPIRCWIADIATQRNHAKEPDYLACRRAIIRRFDSKASIDALPAIEEVQASFVRPAVVFDPQLPNYQHIVLGCVLEFRTAEDRL